MHISFYAMHFFGGVCGMAAVNYYMPVLACSLAQLSWLPCFFLCCHGGPKVLPIHQEMDAIQQSAVYGGKICKQGKSRVLVVVEEEEVLEQQTMLCDLQSVVLSGI